MFTYESIPVDTCHYVMKGCRIEADLKRYEILRQIDRRLDAQFCGAKTCQHRHGKLPLAWRREGERETEREREREQSQYEVIARVVKHVSREDEEDKG